MFDGDAMGHMLLLDKKFAKVADRLAPEANLFGLHSINWPGPMADMPKPVAATISSWIEDPSTTRPDILERMKQFQ